ncbi:MAG: hypothetical protein M3Y27_17775 [Acidobacteriota bacterium]|nr:hypothetical protein [Acidobacteriota bacterium]MDQ2947755.1 hypothetical protein [Acidobacteriota bacterium]
MEKIEKELYGKESGSNPSRKTVLFAPILLQPTPALPLTIPAPRHINGQHPLRGKLLIFRFRQFRERWFYNERDAGRAVLETRSVEMQIALWIDRRGVSPSRLAPPTFAPWLPELNHWRQGVNS